MKKFNLSTKVLSFSLGTFLMTLFGKASTVLASMYDEYNPEDIKTGSDGTFDPVIETIDGMGASAYQVVMRVAIISGILCVVFLGISLFLFTSAMSRENNKSKAMYICAGLCVVFGAVAIVSGFQAVFAG